MPQEKENKSGQRSDGRAARSGAVVLSTFIDSADWDIAVGRIRQWAIDREPRTVCLCNVHSAVTAREDNSLANALASTDLVLPDGAPIAWTLRRKGFSRQIRMPGPELMVRVCEDLEGSGIGVFLFGSSEATLIKLRAALGNRFPGLDIRGMLSPPFGKWSEAQEQGFISEIESAGAGVIFVGLGCPRQEIWMSRNKERVSGVMLGVGAAFDFHAGSLKRAPRWAQNLGLEWLHRLLSEPRRLWRRYLVTNSRFLLSTGREILFRK